MGTVNVYVRNATTGAAGARLTGVTSSTSGNKVTYTIPCSLLTANTDYLIEIPRGGSGNKEYDVEFRAAGTTNISISGPSVVCATNVTFTAQNVPAGMTINWTKPAFLTYVSGQGTATYTVRANGSGTGNITLQVLNGCGSVTASRTVEAGILNSSEMTLEGPSAFCNNTTSVSYWVVPPNGHQSHYIYNWTWPAEWTRLYQTQNAIVLSVPGGSASSGGFLSMTVNNGCGTSAPLGRTVYTYPCGSSSVSSTSIYPNPAEESITVELDESKCKEAKEIRLINNTQKVVKEKKTSGSKVVFDVTDLPSGMYYLIVTYKDSQESHHLVIER